MTKRFGVVFVTVAVTVLTSGVCLAGIPLPPLCTIEASGNGDCSPGATVCPEGDGDVITVFIELIDQYGMPVGDQPVDIWADLDATGFRYCPLEDLKTTVTNIDGQATVTFARFGGCGDLSFYAECLYVPIGPSDLIYVASYDNDGNLQVDLNDFIGFAGAYLTANPCCDYDCSGLVDLSDFIQFAGHYLHACW
ncbi:MAG: Ig-like domain-containing protein [Candidatus Eisenbacteria bacterium]